MSQFEFLLTGFAIVLALSVARLLDGLRPAFQPGKIYWVHALWVVNKLFSTTLYFWSAWITRSTGTWNFTDYLIIIAAPAVVYLQANVLVTPSPDEVEDWRAHYYKNHRWFFAANFLLCPIGILATHVVAEWPFPAPADYAFAFVGLFSLVAAATSNSRVHSIVAVVAALNLLVGFGSQLGTPTP